jgi:hypothetical protein
MISPIIHGISPVLPVLVIFLILVLSLFTAWWSYQSLQQLEIKRKVALITLRGLSLFILIMLLFNPFILTETEHSDRSAVAVYYDNSQSMSVVRGEFNGAEDYRRIMDDFRSTRDDIYQFNEFLFDDQIIEFDILSLSGSRTNFDTLFEHLRERENRYIAAVILSDGILTQGRNPLFTAQNLTIPVITIPIGDTSNVKDVAISGVDYSPTVYSYTSQNIQIEVQQEGFEGEMANVQIMKDGQRIENVNLEFQSTISSQLINFIDEYDEPGFHEYEIIIPSLPDEYTDLNNRTTFTVEVLDDKTQILSIALEVHPDVRSIRKLIATDQQNELITTMRLDDGRYIGLNPIITDIEPDLIVLHGLPDVQSDLFQWLIDQRYPLLIHLLPSTFHNAMEQDMSNLSGFSLSGMSDPVQIQFDLQSAIGTHPILETPNITTARLPALRTFRGDYRLTPLSEPIIMSRFEGTETDLPMIITVEPATLRKAIVTAFGWFRYEQNSEPEIREIFQNLITNLVSWSSTPPDRRTLTLSTQKDSYSENESIIVRAELFNERGEPETEAFIDLSIYEGDSEEPLRQMRMTHQQNELYSAELGYYPQGIYRLRATASRNERSLGTAESRVVVSESIVEFLNTKRDDQLLNQIAEITNGRFLESSDIGRINEVIDRYHETEGLQSNSEDFYFIYRSGYWFLIVLILLSAEWIIRRSVSLP